MAKELSLDLSRRRTSFKVPAAVLAIAALLLTFLLSIGMGPLNLSMSEVLSALASRLTGAELNEIEELNAAVVWDLRLARAVTAVIIGASLAACGAAMQGLFGNPLADPGIIGVSSGASLGAILVIVLGISSLGVWTLPFGAFVAGVITTMVIYAFSRPDGDGADSSRLLLVGIAINSICGAISGLMTYLATTDQLMSMTFWSMGSLSSARWLTVGITIVPAVVGLLFLQIWAKQLDLLALGERQARHLGVDVITLRRWLVVITALLVASAVSFSGTIGFIGLIVPHIVRLTIGPMHRYLLPLSALGGALLLMLADIAARTLDPPGEVPIGVLMGALGGPFFLWMIQRRKGR
ncbi:ABC-type Fe3+-siderophore transport system, permease component [Phaeobacter piscinae]|uniref:ABC-type Fe3+-siderophore transport system, permease component n=1 Tax=Phaeobacter piscinae TaxID=1580596 RepID=A0AAN1LB31_9RHOB|nr:iron ABC transporter permease [Phaeobacter piscinae]ATG44222.1 ABC-type Fe3+-siderophore transport system, permease component [Phaeobacter piscinae]AUQ73606.1 ABC-type Fe3+-siderophore transport system, permease component [Phaeobacter piscinae]AUR36532.1 ABC-type Fe3+-siderophore transport system, permease component [Phaeobacter piscinae]